ncbi:MAG: hypothetical protein NZ728_02635 [Oleiphilaceae bacterium]|nr:hypothetical protein [Oleiphilaceae bacterium]
MDALQVVQHHLEVLDVRGFGQLDDDVAGVHPVFLDQANQDLREAAGLEGRRGDVDGQAERLLRVRGDGQLLQGMVQDPFIHQSDQSHALRSRDEIAGVDRIAVGVLEPQQHFVMADGFGLDGEDRLVVEFEQVLALQGLLQQ